MFYQRDAARNRGILMDDRQGWPLAHSEGQESRMNPWYNFRRRYQVRNMIERDPISRELRGRVGSQMSDGMIPLENYKDY